MFLSINTAFPGSCSLAVLDDNGQVLSEDSLSQERGHDQVLFTLIESVLTKASVSLDDIDHIITTVGPGSFTGIRIGIAATEGLCVNRRLSNALKNTSGNTTVPMCDAPEAYGITAFAVLLGAYLETAQKQHLQMPTWTLLPTQTGAFYGQLWTPNGDNTATPQAPQIIPLEQVTLQLKDPNCHVVLSGSTVLADGYTSFEHTPLARHAGLAMRWNLFTELIPYYLIDPSFTPQEALPPERPLVH